MPGVAEKVIPATEKTIWHRERVPARRHRRPFDACPGESSVQPNNFTASSIVPPHQGATLAVPTRPFGRASVKPPPTWSTPRERSTDLFAFVVVGGNQESGPAAAGADQR